MVTCNMFVFLTVDIVTLIFLAWTVSIVETRTLIACPRRNMMIQVNSTGHHKCSPCSDCPIGNQKSQRCTLWRDTECKPCTEGTFNKRDGSKCKQCTVCKPGERIVRKCSSVQDALCAPCLRGTFSDFADSNYCKVCSRCKPFEEVSYLCNTTNDTGCGACKQEYYRESATGGCLPCTKCYGSSKVVPECYQKNKGYSDKNCMSMDRIWVLSTTVTSTMHVSIYGTDDQLYAALIPFLLVILFATAVVVAVYVCINSSNTAQWYIRKIRDMGRKDVNIDKADKEDHLCHGKKRKKVSDMLLSWWVLFKRRTVMSKDNDCREIGVVLEGEQCLDEMIKVTPRNNLVHSSGKYNKNILQNNSGELENLLLCQGNGLNHCIEKPTSQSDTRDMDTCYTGDSHVADTISIDSGCEQTDGVYDEEAEIRKLASVSTTMVYIDTGTDMDSRINLAGFGSRAFCDSANERAGTYGTKPCRQQGSNTLGRIYGCSNVEVANVKDTFYTTL